MEDTAVFVLYAYEDISAGSAATDNSVVEAVWIDDVATEPADQKEGQQ